MQDLKRTGLLDETLVVWGGEFGRTAMREERNGSKLLGRDHHADCFTIWMAGAGIHPGRVHGATGDFGTRILRDPIGVHDYRQPSCISWASIPTTCATLPRVPTNA